MNMDYASADITSAKYKIERSFAEFINLMDGFITKPELIKAAQQLSVDVLKYAGISPASSEKGKEGDQIDGASIKSKKISALGNIAEELLKKDVLPEEAFLIFGSVGTENIVTATGNPFLFLRLFSILKKKQPALIGILQTILNIV